MLKEELALEKRKRFRDFLVRIINKILRVESKG